MPAERKRELFEMGGHLQLVHLVRQTHGLLGEVSWHRRLVHRRVELRECERVVEIDGAERAEAADRQRERQLGQTEPLLRGVHGFARQPPQGVVLHGAVEKVDDLVIRSQRDKTARQAAHQQAQCCRWAHRAGQRRAGRLELALQVLGGACVVFEEV